MMMGKMCGLHKVCVVLVLIGAINWGLVGAFNINLVMMIFGSMPLVERIVYILVGVAGLCMLGQKKCCGGSCMCGNGSCDHCNGKKEEPKMGTA